MKKKVLTILAATMLASSVSFAAPITDLQQNETSIGYNHYNLDASGLNIDSDSFHLEHGIGDKVIVGVERNVLSLNGADEKMTDVYAHYKIDQNVRLIVGNRDNSDSSKMFYGIGASTALSEKVDGYASVTTNSDATEWQTGVNYKLSNQASLHLGYKSHKEDGLPNIDGIGFGVNYKF